MEPSSPPLRRSRREHQPSAKAAAAAAPAAAAAGRRPPRRRVARSPSPAAERAPSQRRRAHAAHTPSTRRVLGRYSSRECALLCEAVAAQLKRQTLAPSVLDERRSPALIRWEPVARRLESAHRLRVSARDCQQLWKFLAYGRPPDAADAADSDVEDLLKSPRQINAQLADAAAQPPARARPQQTRPRAQQAQTDAQPPVRLYPTYALPAGAPDDWHRAFGPRDALPLTFVASRFLRRKATPPTQAPAAAAELKRKLAAAEDAASKKQKVPTPLATPPRVFTPSSTPPPAAKRARSELEFFELRLREEQEKKTPGSKFQLSPADIQRRFGDSSAEVRRQCQTLAAHDVERFNREVVRVRIWQKAMGATSVKPTPAPASTSVSKTTASPGSATTTSPATASVSKSPAANQKPGATAATDTKDTAVVTKTTIGSGSTEDQKDGGSKTTQAEAK